MAAANLKRHQATPALDSPDVMRIALVNKHLQLGGIETVVHQLWCGLRNRGWSADLWVSEYYDWPTGDGLRLMYPRLLNRLQHSRLSSQMQRSWSRRTWTQRAFRRLRKMDYDLVHVHGFDGTYASLEALVELAHAKPVVLTLHGPWWFTGGCAHPIGCDRFTQACGECPQLGVWPVPAEDNTAAELANKRKILQDAPIHFISPALHLRSDAARSVPGRHWKIAHIPNGVNTTFFRGDGKHDPRLRQAYGIDPDRITVLAMCRDFRDVGKGANLMVSALRLIDPSTVQVILVGAFTDAIADRLPPELRPMPMGYVESAAARRDLFEIADVFFFTSLAETFPCVVLEAMSSECCVVSTPIPAMSEQIVHGKTGLIAHACTDLALAEQLSAACARPAWAAQIGRDARRSVQQRFSEEQMLDRHLTFYEDALR